MPLQGHRDATTEALERARTAYDARRWEDAYRAFGEADARAPLGLGDLERYGWSAGLAGHDDGLLSAWGRRYDALMAQGDELSAADMAFSIGFRLMGAGEAGHGGAWLSRCARLVDKHPDACREQGYVRFASAMRKLGGGDLQGSHDDAADAVAAAERCGDVDLAALGRHVKGRVLLVP